MYAYKEFHFEGTRTPYPQSRSCIRAWFECSVLGVITLQAGVGDYIRKTMRVSFRGVP